jgi:Ca2+-binding EF-hand superfamily protein
MVANYFKITTEEAYDICLSVDDFLEFAVEILTNRDSVDSLKKSFACFDAEDKGYLVMKDLMRVCKEIHENFSDEDLEMMMAHIDKDGGGSVTLDEWITVMSDAF